MTTPSASHIAGDDPGVMRHVTEAFNPAGELAKPEEPVIVVNVVVAPGATVRVSGVTVGTAGIATVG